MGKHMYPQAPDMRQRETQQMTDGELFFIHPSQSKRPPEKPLTLASMRRQRTRAPSSQFKKTDIKVGDRIVIHAVEVNKKLVAHTVELGAR